MSVFTNGVYARLVTDRIGVGVTVAPGGGAGTPAWYTGFVTSDPNGVITGTVGCALWQNNGTLWINNDDGTGWTAAAGGVSTGWNLRDNVAGTWGTTSPLQAESLYVSASNRFDLRTKATIGTQESASQRYITGTNTVLTAAIGGGTGKVDVGTGATDSSSAGGTGGLTGPVNIFTGAALSTLGVSGSTSPVTIYTGASDDANSGNIRIYTGLAPSGTQGQFQVQIPTWDLTAQAVTLNLIDNTANAWSVGSTGAPAILSVSTLNNAEAVASAARLTTTDGVASGTARVVGGRAFSSTSASLTITGGAGAQTYSVSYTIPANTLKAGSVVNISAVVKALTQNAGDTFTAFLRVGGQVVASCAGFDIAANDFGNMRATLNVFAAPGAAVQTIVQGQGGWTTAAAPYGNTGVDSVFATNGALTVDVQITYGSASAGNTSNLSALVVSIT